jgi:hypothetical protein
VVAALKRDLRFEVETVNGRYGEFTVLADGEEIINGGVLAVLGILPSVREIRDELERKIGERQ